jgi:hypothetical protein
VVHVLEGFQKEIVEGLLLGSHGRPPVWVS